MVFRGQNVKNKLNVLTTIIDSYKEIECEIDIRTLTSHQVLGQIFDQVFDQILGQILDQIFDQVLDQGFWTRKCNVQFHWDRNKVTR